MANLTQLSDADFATTVENATLPVLVDFSATWCGPCKALAPIIESVAKNYAGKLDVYTVDIDQAQEVSASYGIRGVPTCIIFKGGKEVDRFSGFRDLRAISQQLDGVVG